MSRYQKKEWDCGNLDGLDPKNPLRSWLEQNNFVRYGSSKGLDYTCTFLNGGTALIPDDKYDTFLQLMATEVEDKRPWSVHENATRFSRLYFDFDILESHFDPNKPISENQIRDWVYTLQCAVYDFFPGATQHPQNKNKTNQAGGRAIVMTAPCAFEMVKKKKSGTAASAGGGGGGGGKASANSATPRDAQRVALAQRVVSGSAPSQSNVLATVRREREESEASEHVVRKTGIHVVFPNIVCDLNEMLEVRAHVVDKLTDEYPPPGDKTWADIVDEQVYVGSAGLRLVGTMKVETCKECRGDARKRKTCDACNGRPRTFVERAYKPTFVHSTAGGLSKKTLNKMNNSVQDMMRLCSIRQVRAYKTTPPFVRPSIARPYTGPRVRYTIDDPSPQNASWANAKRERLLSARPKASKGQSSSAKDATAPLLKGKGGQILNVFDAEHDIAQMLEQFIRQHTYAQWRDIVVTEVRQVLKSANAQYSQPGTYFLINVNDKVSRHCLNLGGEHRSRSIYFVATRNGVYQRCFCQHDTTIDRVSGVPCKEFSSNVCEFLQFSLGRRIQERLFPANGMHAHAKTSHIGAKYGASSQTLHSGTMLLSVERSPNECQFPSVADVRRDTERKRRANGILTSSAQDDDEDEDTKSKSGKRSRQADANMHLPLRPPDGSVSNDELARIDRERRMAEEENPNFSEIDAVECSYTPDFSNDTPSIARALQTEVAQFSSAQFSRQAKRQRQHEEKKTFVTLPVREPPRTIEQYKSLIKRTEHTMRNSACEQIDRFLQK